ncbi:MAG: HAD-IA family hydrolase [Opitutales bacterium]
MSVSLPPAAVSLDLVGTLLFPHPSVGKVYARVARQAGHQVDAEALDQRFASALRAARAKDDARARWDEIVERTFSGTLPAKAIPVVQAGCWEAFGRGDAWRMTRGAAIILAQLRFLGVKVGVLSDGDARLTQVLAEKGLLPSLDAVVLTDGTGVAKPDPAAFGKIARALGCEPSRLVHIGDDLDRDARGANASGALGIWLTDGPAPPGIERLGRLTGLPERVRDLLLGKPRRTRLTRAQRNLVANLRGQPEERGRSSERAVRTIDQAVEEAVRRMGIDRPVPEHAISAAWSRLLPPALARRTAPLRILPDGKLMIQCDGATVRSEATFLARGLLAKIRELPGCGHVKAVGFTVG